MQIIILFIILAVLSGIACLWAVKSGSDRLPNRCRVFAWVGIVITLFSIFFFFFQSEPYAVLSMGFPVFLSGFNTDPIFYLVYICLPLFLFISYLYKYKAKWFRPVAIGSIWLMLFLLIADYLIFSVIRPWYGDYFEIYFNIFDEIWMNPLLWLLLAQLFLCIPLLVEHKRRNM